MKDPDTPGASPAPPLVRDEGVRRPVDEHRSASVQRPPSGDSDAPLPTAVVSPLSSKSARARVSVFEPLAATPRVVRSTPPAAAPAAPPSPPPPAAGVTANVPTASSPSSPPAPAVNATQKNGVASYAPSGGSASGPNAPAPSTPTTGQHSVTSPPPTRDVSASLPRPREVSTPPAAQRQMLRNLLFVAVGVGVLLVVGAQLRRLKDKRTVALAPAVSGVAALWGGPIEEPALVAYVQRIASSLAPHAGLPSLSVHVTRDASVQVLPLPGAEVLLTAGALRRLSSEAQLAGLLAHAAAHIARGDVEQQFATLSEPDLPKRAALAGAAETPAREEMLLDPIVAGILTAAGYPSGGFADAFPLLGAQGGGVSAFALAHPHTQDRLRAQRVLHPEGRTAESDYGRLVLDRLGRTVRPAAPVVAVPKAPPPPLQAAPSVRPLTPQKNRRLLP